MDASNIIEKLALAPHPEGGYYRRTYQCGQVLTPRGMPCGFEQSRPVSTAILFLLRAGQYSRLHRIRQDELWHFHLGGPLRLVWIDKVGRARMYMWGSLITGIVSFPAFWLMSTSNGNMMMIWLATIIPFGILYAMVYAPEAALFCDLFDAKVRYTGISFVYQFSGIFASGITPIIATALLKVNGGQPWLICAYVLFAGLVSAWCAAMIGKDQKARIEEPEPKVTLRPART